MNQTKIFFEITEEEFTVAKEFADFHNININEAFKQVFFEKLEDEYDLRVANESYDEYIKSGKQSRPVQELWNELNI